MKIFIFLLSFIPFIALGQRTHTVSPKETWYSVGRTYNVHPRELAAYNNISMESGLTIGQVIKIPGKGNSSSVASTAPSKSGTEVLNSQPSVNEVRVPVYHKVEKKQTLYGISKLYKNVSVDNIKQWNNLSADGVSEGAELIVGYKKEKKSDQISKDKPVSENKAIEVKEVSKPTVKEKVEPTAEPIKEVKSVVKVSPQETSSKSVTVSSIGKGFNGGFFKSLYVTQTSETNNVSEQTGIAAVFKSTSGWDDGKYYCLHNTAPAGTILKITNKNNNKIIYAKVLDVIPDLKQNTGILLRLSNAAADELGAGENDFESLINY